MLFDDSFGRLRIDCADLCDRKVGEVTLDIFVELFIGLLKYLVKLFTKKSWPYVFYGDLHLSSLASGFGDRPPCFSKGKISLIVYSPATFIHVLLD